MDLNNTFDVYYNRGILALNDNKYHDARMNILKASETLLKQAKLSDGVEKANLIKRAQELYKLSVEIEDKITSILNR